MSELSELVGKTLTAVRRIGGEGVEDRVEFECTDGSEYVLFHSQDCCESVNIESIVGNLDDLVGSPILMADESTSENQWPAEVAEPKYKSESFTWTFYKFGTLKGYVDIRWLGESNGYYSESVYFARARDPRPAPRTTELL